MLIGALAVLLIAMPLVVGVMATEEPTENSGNRIRQWILLRMQQMKRQFNAFIRFFKGAESTVITGTVTARSNNILIVTDGDSNRYNILLPRKWNVDQSIVPLSEIDQYLSGEVTVKTLSRTTTNDKGVTISVLIAHEITSNGVTLYSVQPYNING
jgi:hypothetical protein